MKNKLLILAGTVAAFVFVGLNNAQAQTEEKKTHTLTITTENFDETVKKGVVLVDFWATWCRPCVMQGPIIDHLADSLHGKVKIGKVDTDKNRALSQRFGIQYIPTTIIFVDGVAVDKASGLQSKEVLIKRLTPYLK
ncbi:MAG: thioredoxin [Bacteroidales bacterium]|nr:thioredoxin [Bacteroidales bacterium]HPE99166.1 thioredoxin [Bacteroidales bacterium]